MITSPLALAEVVAVSATSVIAIGIGLFYRLKFGESARVWLIGGGATLGAIGQVLSSLPGVPPQIADIVFLPGALLVAAGTFWLWFVMLGPRR